MPLLDQLSRNHVITSCFDATCVARIRVYVQYLDCLQVALFRSNEISTPFLYALQILPYIPETRNPYWISSRLYEMKADALHMMDFVFLICVQSAISDVNGSIFELSYVLASYTSLAVVCINCHISHKSSADLSSSISCMVLEISLDWNWETYKQSRYCTYTQKSSNTSCIIFLLNFHTQTEIQYFLKANA